LYRREFEFLTPQFPEDDFGQSGDEEDEQSMNEQFQGQNEIINGIEIQTHALASPVRRQI
jgi:hypothetical protein